MTPEPPAGPAPAFPEPSQATTALVLGIVGVILCGVLAPFAWVIGSKEVKAIDAGRRDPSNRGVATAGKILGIVGTVLLVVGVLVTLFVLLGLVAFTVSGVNVGEIVEELETMSALGHRGR
jgi:TRAP-type C4-dicarboxylate transport system permease small subunit